LLLNANDTFLWVALVCQELVTFVDISEHISDDDDELLEIIALCGSFLILRDRIISFVHQSVREILSEKATSVVFPSGRDDVHNSIFLRSLQAMSKTLKRDIDNLGDPGVLTDQIEQPDPDPLAMIKYSCAHWIDHFGDCNNGQTPRKDLQDVEESMSFCRRRISSGLKPSAFSEAYPVRRSCWSNLKTYSR
jgi:hypothetical protein